MAVALAPWQPPLARSKVYAALAVAFLYPEAGTRDRLQAKARTAAEAARQAGWSEIAQAAAVLADSALNVSDETLIEQYVEIFGHGVSKDCPQYEAEYEESHVFMKSQVLAGLGAFYKAFGVDVNPDMHDRLDHISVELDFMQLLTLKEAYAGANGHGEDKVLLCHQAQGSFLSEHMANWSGSFIRRLSKKAVPGGFYEAAAHLLDLSLKTDFAAFGIQPAHPQVPVTRPESDPGEPDDCPLDPPA